MPMGMIERAEIDRRTRERDEARAECAQWKAWGIVEIAARNPSVMEYIKHWEGRTERAEARLAQAVALLRDLHTVLRNRHHGRMPDDVQRAYDAAGAFLRAGAERAPEQHAWCNTSENGSWRCDVCYDSPDAPQHNDEGAGR